MTQRLGAILDAATDLMFLAAFFLAGFKLFWGVFVRGFTMHAWEIVAEWPAPLRAVALLAGVGLPVGVVAFYLFSGDEDGRPPLWLRAAQARKDPRIASGLQLVRKALASLGMFALLKLAWLTGDESTPDGRSWWLLLGEFLKAF